MQVQFSIQNYPYLLLLYFQFYDFQKGSSIYLTLSQFSQQFLQEKQRLSSPLTAITVTDTIQEHNQNINPPNKENKITSQPNLIQEL